MNRDEIKDTPFKTIYNEVEVTYNETEDHWEFVLRGRKRTAQSLSKAKEAIDKEPVEARKKMEPIKVFMFQNEWGQTKIVHGQITSFDLQYGRPAAWWSTKGQRAKESLDRFFLDTPENAALVQEIHAIEKERDVLKEKAQAKRDLMTRPQQPK